MWSTCVSTVSYTHLWLDSSVLASLKRYGNEEQMETYAVLREAFLSGEPDSVEPVSYTHLQVQKN